MNTLTLVLLLVSFLVNFSTSITVCPPGFLVLNSNKCVKLFQNKVSQRSAETSCRYFGGTLVNVKNSIDNRAVSSLAADVDSLWMGLFCFADTNTTSCFHDDQSGQSTYSNFAPGFPLINDQYGGCVYMATSGSNTGKWYNGNCDVGTMAFMCEVPISSADKDACVHNYNGYCYFPSTELRLTAVNTTYAQAMSICQSKAASLVSVHSMREIDYVKSLYRKKSATKLFLGAQAMIPDLFQWADKSQFNFTYMDPMSSAKGDCLQMDLTTGFWTETDCENNRLFVCKRPTSNSNGNKLNEQEEIAFNFNNFVDGPDFSNCNTTLLMAPGKITSFGYPHVNMPKYYCSYRLVTQGPFKLGLYFSDIAAHSSVYIFDEYGKVLADARSAPSVPWGIIAPSNIVTVTYQSMGARGFDGFSATAIPI